MEGASLYAAVPWSIHAQIDCKYEYFLVLSRKSKNDNDPHSAMPIGRMRLQGGRWKKRSTAGFGRVRKHARWPRRITAHAIQDAEKKVQKYCALGYGKAAGERKAKGRLKDEQATSLCALPVRVFYRRDRWM